MHYWIVSLELG